MIRRRLLLLLLGWAALAAEAIAGRLVPVGTLVYPCAVLIACWSPRILPSMAAGCLLLASWILQPTPFPVIACVLPGLWVFYHHLSVRGADPLFERLTGRAQRRRKRLVTIYPLLMVAAAGMIRLAEQLFDQPMPEGGILWTDFLRHTLLPYVPGGAVVILILRMGDELGWRRVTSV